MTANRENKTRNQISLLEVLSPITTCEKLTLEKKFLETVHGREKKNKRFILGEMFL